MYIIKEASVSGKHGSFFKFENVFWLMFLATFLHAINNLVSLVMMLGYNILFIR